MNAGHIIIKHPAVPPDSAGGAFIIKG